MHVLFHYLHNRQNYHRVGAMHCCIRGEDLGVKFGQRFVEKIELKQQLQQIFLKFDTSSCAPAKCTCCVVTRTLDYYTIE